jgi:hypothetical protein
MNLRGPTTMKHKLLHSRLSLLAAALTGAVAPAQALTWLVLGGPATQQAGAEGSIGAATGQGEDIVPSVASTMLRGFMAHAWQMDSTRLRCNTGP